MKHIYAYKEDQKRVQDYVFRNCDLWCDKDIWDSIVYFQEKNRRIARQRKKEKLSAQINKKMELVPALPGDWRKWVEKVGADKNYIFYDAGKSVQTGYCTYCEREVPVIKPRYNKWPDAVAAERKSSINQIGKEERFLISMRYTCYKTVGRNLF